MKSGFPSAISTTVAAPSSTALAARCCSASSWLEASLRGSSWRLVYAGSPPPQAGRSVRSSGLASATRSTGTSRTRAASISSRSSWLASAQWMSSNRSIVGVLIASDSTNTRAEKKTVSRSATVRSSPSPSRSSSCGACSSAAAGPARAATLDTSFARASSGSSLSKIVAVCLTSCANALYGVLAPYGVERPRIARGSLVRDEFASSSPRRDLPMPAGPNTVTNCARLSCVTRSQIPAKYFELAVAPDHRHGRHRALAGV